MAARGLHPGRKATLRADMVLLAAVSSLSFAACASPIEGGEPQPRVGRAIQGIVNGAASGADQDAVVALARFDGGARVGLCTATLVAPNLVVTARHCVSATDAAAACGSDGLPVVGALLHGDREPASLAVFVSMGGTAPDTTTASGARAHGKALVVDDATTICNHDLAFVVLDTPITTALAPIRLAPPSASETITAVGFGITELGALPSSRMQRGGLTLVGTGPMAYPDDARYGVGDAEFLVGESACSGDSGSPAIAKTGAVVGVASRAGNGQPRDPNNAASTCLGASAHAVYTQLGAHPAFVLQAFTAAGATPWLEGQPDPRVPARPPVGGAGGAAGASSRGPDATNNGQIVTSGEAEAQVGDRVSHVRGGCAASAEPTGGAVEHALGIVAALLLLLRVRAARRDEPAEDPGQQRIPYHDLGMRESAASLHDDV